MKSLLIALSLVVAGTTVALSPFDADARRLGAGRNAGMQRQAPPPAKPADATPARQAETTPAQPGAPGAAPTNAAAATGAAAPAAAAANAGRRSWMGPVAGLAAGLGIAALAGYLGFGEALANFITLLLLALVAVFAIRWLMRRFGATRAEAPGNLRLAGAAAGGPRVADLPRPLQRSADAWQPPATAGGSSALAGFDAGEFERVAKMIFIRLQAANDAGNLDDLRKFTTPELFAALRLDLHERAGRSQQTDVMQLHAQVLETAVDDGQQVVSVRFHGLVREEAEATAQPFDETWHLVRPADGSKQWAIAGIAQNAEAGAA